MTETNQEAQVSESTVWLRLNPLTLWSAIAVTLASFVVPGVAITVILTVAGMFLPWGLLSLLVSVLVAGVLVGTEILRYHHARYRVTDERLEVQSGVLARTHLTLSRERVRSVDVATPLLARPFGLCKVTVGTGQKVAAGDEITLTYVTTSEADRLRRVLLHQDTTAPDTTPEREPGDPSAASVLATMAPAWFSYGMTSPAPATLVFSIVLGAVGSMSEYIVRWALSRYGSIGSAMDLGVLLMLALGTVLLAMLGALALHTEAWWNYRLTREPDGTLRVRRGLLNLSSVSIEERRLRGVEIREFLPVRWFGAASVLAVASGLGAEGGGSGSLVPKRALSSEVPRAEAERIADAALPGATIGPLTAHPKAALRRRLVRAAAAVAGLTVLTVALILVISAEPVARISTPSFALWTAVVVLAVTALLAGLYAWGCYRGLGHGLSEHHLRMRRGMAARSTAVLRRDAVIGWTIRRSFFQRRAGLATIGATIAAEKGVFHATDIDNSEGLAFAEDAVPGLLTPFLERG